MSGLDKITEHITDKARAEARNNIDKADKEAEAILKIAQEEAENMRSEAEKRLKIDCDRIAEMAQAADRQEKRQILLLAKSEVIKAIIDEAKNRLKNMETEQYTGVLETILKNSMTSQKGEILFSKKDKERLDAAFIEKISTASDGKLSVSEDTAEIENGFIIRYGKIEQNCSVDSMFEDKYNELTDIVNSCLMTD